MWKGPPYIRLKEKYGIKKGYTYVEPKTTLRQAAAWVEEYFKTYSKS